MSNNLKLSAERAFFECAILPPGGYGHNSKELVVSAPGDHLNAKNIGEIFRDSETNILALPEDGPYDVEFIANGLRDCMGVNYASMPPNPVKFVMNFSNAQSFRSTIAANLKLRSQTGAGLGYLSDDMRCTVEKLGGVFNLNAPFKISLICGREADTDLHTDFGDEKRTRAVRPLSRFGTLTPVMNDLNLMPDRRFNKYSYKNPPAHTGSGLVILGGDAPHSAHPTAKPRWVYTIDGQSL